MKLITLFLTVACVNVTAAGYSQKISLSAHDASLQQVFKQIEKQTDYRFVYTKEQLQKIPPLTVDWRNVTLEKALKQCLLGQHLSYTIEDNLIIIQKKSETVTIVLLDVKGKVTNEKGQPLAGITVTVKGTKKTTVTDGNGEFTLNNIDDDAIFMLSGAEMETQELKVNNQPFIAVQLKTKLTELDQILVMAYGTTTKRLNTGSITRVSADEISKQPVTNPLLALQGRVPGLAITQSSGLNGAAVKVQLRGQNSILQGSEPFYIIDGIPYAPGNSKLNQITNATSEMGMSPFNLFNPSDIESIEILKDADATAIYGSRAANGVILITTKKGQAGKARLMANVYTGVSKVTRTMDMLNTAQYRQMRKEAFANDGLTPSADPTDPGFAADLMVWDSTRYTDLKKLLIGGTLHTTDAQLSYSGGNSNTQFLLGAGYHRESTVFPSDLDNIRSSFHFNLNQTSANKKFNLSFNGNYVYNRNELNIRDLTSFINLPPNIKLFDDADRVNWEENGFRFRSTLGRLNPFAALKTIYKGNFKNLTTNLNFNYQLLYGLQARVNIGYNHLQANENSAQPSTSFDPYSGNLPAASFANRTQSSWITEPQLEYSRMGKAGTIKLLLGSTWQQNSSDGIFVQALNYSSDLLLGSISGAARVRSSNAYSQYRYTAFFGRINYNYKDQYIINLSGRRDGSSRFGPAKRFSNFGAAGLAWMFSKKRFIQNKLPFLSFGKLRASYGITGNDQIGDYRYLDTWTTSSTTYQGVPVLTPSSLLNADFSWEKTRKLELAIELGFLQERIFLSIARFRNKSGNQLINYSLPVQTGAENILKNLDALLQNQGTEFQLTSKNIISKNFSWTSSFNLSSNKNKLLSFPGLSSSSYANTYFLGKSVSTRLLYKYLGVDNTTGLYTFEDIDHNGTLDNTDMINFVNTDPKFFGGFLNTVTYKQFTIDVFIEFKKQKGYDYLSNNSSIFVPGYLFYNQPVIVLQRWQKPGDNSAIQRFTASSSSQAFEIANNNLPSSDANISDASFIRFKNISASYRFPGKWTRAFKLESGLIYIHAQNLLTLTHYKGSDPETQNMFVLPPLKTFVFGLQLTL